MSDDFPDREDRRRTPDEFSYRLGAVEQLAKRSDEELTKLERAVAEFIAGMPSQYPTRREHDKIADQLNELSAHLNTYVATANASNAIREKNIDQSRTVRLQWPVWLLMALDTVIAAVALLHH